MGYLTAPAHTIPHVLSAHGRVHYTYNVVLGVIKEVCSRERSPQQNREHRELGHHRTILDGWVKQRAYTLISSDAAAYFSEEVKVVGITVL